MALTLIDGDGGWFHVDVVVRTGAMSSDELVAAARSALVEVEHVPAEVADPASACSYDAEPPEGSAGLGVWVRSASIGGAVDAAVALIAGVVEELAGSTAELWDVRALPVDAVLRPVPEGAASTLSAADDG